MAAFSLDDWNKSPIAKPAWCDVPARTASIKTWAAERHAVVVERLGP